MHPILFELKTPGFLEFLFGDTVTVYSYGTLIALGAILGFIYTAWRSKKEFNVPYETTNELILYILISAIIGGKLFIIFEDPQKYLSNPSLLLSNFKQGFVFYGSLLFAIPTMLIFFKIKKLPMLAMLDIMAITTCLVHGTGRIGCFMAGCCHGSSYDGIFSVVFTNPVCQAPLNTPLHASQLYEVGFIYGIMVILFIVRRKRQFKGQIFLLYLMLYSIGRSWLEIYRGDLSRGFIIDNLISNSQFISFLVFCGTLFIYIKLKILNIEIYIINSHDWR